MAHVVVIGAGLGGLPTAYELIWPSRSQPLPKRLRLVRKSKPDSGD